MMHREQKLPVIVLAGGFGTRLKKVVADRPKPMAPINGKPFLEYLLATLIKTEAVSSIILSVGYLHEQIIGYFGNTFGGVPISYSIEDSPLGTGGAVVKAAGTVANDDFILVNGDTMFTVDLQRLLIEHERRGADVTIALKRMRDFDRYGTVVCTDGVITRFEEKRAVAEGLINGGVYVVHLQALLSRGLPEVFSLEKDFLQAYATTLKMYGVVFDNYFIDIGIPGDFARAQVEFKQNGEIT